MKSNQIAYTFATCAAASFALAYTFRNYSTQINPPNTDTKKWQTHTFYDARLKGIDLSITKKDIQSKHIDCKIFNISPHLWIIKLNKKIGVVDVNCFTGKLSKIIAKKHFDPFLWELVKLIETGKIMRFDVVDITVDDKKVCYNGKVLNGENHYIFFILLVESLYND